MPTAAAAAAVAWCAAACAAQPAVWQRHYAWLRAERPVVARRRLGLDCAPRRAGPAVHLASTHSATSGG